MDSTPSLRDHLVENELKDFAQQLWKQYRFRQAVDATDTASRRAYIRALFNRAPRPDIGSFDEFQHEVEKGIALILQMEEWPKIGKLLFNLVVDAAMWETWCTSETGSCPRISSNVFS